MKNNNKNKLQADLSSEIIKLNSILDNLKIDIDIIQNGDSDGPFWNGNIACDAINNVLDKVEETKKLADILSDCSNKIKK